MTALTWAPEFGAVIAGDSSGKVTIYDGASGATRRELECETSVTCVAYAPELRAVISGDSIRHAWGRLCVPQQYKK